MWRFEISIKVDCRKYLGEDHAREGLAWTLDRIVGDYRQSIAASPNVFEHQEDAIQDAINKLSVLRCPIDAPLDCALKWMLDEM